MIVQALTGLFVVFLLFSSLAVWTEIVVRLKQGRPVLPVTPQLPLRWPTGTVAITIAWIGFQLFSLLFFRAPETDREPSVKLVFASIAFYVIMIPILLGTLRVSSGHLRQFGVSEQDFGRNAFIGVKGFLASLVPVYAVMLSTLFLRSPETEHEFLQLLRGADAWYVVPLVGLAAIVLAPLAEELLFRVILQGWLETRLRSPAAAIGISSVVFAAVHGWPDMVPLVPLAMCLGFVFQRTRSYVAVVVMHALFNLLNFAMVLLTQLSDAPPT